MAEKNAVNKDALRYGGITIVGLFLLTIVSAINFHYFLHIPPVFVTMTGLAYLKLQGLQQPLGFVITDF